MAIMEGSKLTVHHSIQLASFVEVLELVQGWTVDFRQLDRDQSSSSVFQTQLGSILVTGGRFGCSISQVGIQPPGMRSFALQEEHCPDMLWYGHLVGPDVLLSFPAHGEVAVMSNPGFKVTTFSVPEYIIENYAEHNQLPSIKSVLGSGEKIFQISQREIELLRALCDKISAIALIPATDKTLVLLLQEIGEQVLESLMSIIFGEVSGRVVCYNEKHRKISQLIEVMNSQSEGLTSMSEIYRLSGLPARTAQNIFREELSMTPKAYLNGLRLYAVHKALWQADVDRVKIADIANQFGFWHMGQFAQNYRNNFGENPSETLARKVR